MSNHLTKHTKTRDESSLINNPGMENFSYIRLKGKFTAKQYSAMKIPRRMGENLDNLHFLVAEPLPQSPLCVCQCVDLSVPTVFYD